MTEKEILRRQKVDEETELLKYIKELVVLVYNNSDTHTDEEDLKFSKCIEMLESEINLAPIKKII